MNARLCNRGHCPRTPEVYDASALPVEKTEWSKVTAQQPYKAQQASGSHLCVAHIYAVILVLTS